MTALQFFKFQALVCLFSFSLTAQAGRTMVIPFMRLRAQLSTAASGDQQVLIKNDDAKYNLKHFQVRYRIEFNNISTVTQNLKFYFRAGTTAQYPFFADEIFSSKTLIQSVVLSPGESDSLFFDSECFFGIDSNNPKGAQCGVVVRGGSTVDRENDIDSDLWPTTGTYLRKNYNQSAFNSAVPDKDIVKSSIAFPLGLTIEIDEDKGAVTAMVGTIGNFNVRKKTEVPVSLNLLGASGVIPINGGRPF